MKRTIFVLAVMVLGACGGGGDSDYAYLYDPPTGDSTDGLYGTWGGSVDSFDTRWVIDADQLILANKCDSKIVGITVAADASDTGIRILESADDGGDSCFVRAMPVEFTVCADPEFGGDYCFARDGLSMRMYFTVIDYIDLVKLQD
jgi:hypothetical protein